VITINQISKAFRHYNKEPGIWGALRSFVIREYKTFSAVDSFDLEIRQGEFIGLLGPNGAGKTTLMKMMTGIIVPSSGQMHVLGFEPHRRDIEFRKRISLVMGQKSQLWWDIPALDSLMMLQRYYDIDDASFKTRLHELSSLLEVGHILKVHVRKLSLGERMKLELLACLLHRPDVVFLDEPTIGLDVSAQKNIRIFLADYQKETGCTIILTSHYMADVASLCSRIVLITGGKKRFDGTFKAFESILGSDKLVTFRFSDPAVYNHSFWLHQKVNWSEDLLEAELHIPEKDLRNTSLEILKLFPVVDFATEQMPIERVMEEIVRRPELIHATALNVTEVPI
jgi:ABC-2 type transport system ATP-binding protein